MKAISILNRNLVTTPKLNLLRRNSTISHHNVPQPLQIDTTITSIRSVYTDPVVALRVLCNNVASLKKTHSLLIVHGLTRDLLTETKLVSSYGSFGQLEWAQLVFDQIQVPDLYSCKVMLRMYLLNDLYHQIIPFYSRMKKCFNEQDNVVFSIVLKACRQLHDLVEGRKLHCQIVKVGGPDRFVVTGLGDMYAKCGEIESARHVFEESLDRNVVSWTSMIVRYVQNGCLIEGILMFNRMRQCLVQPNQFTVQSLLTACSKLDALHQGKWVHGYFVKVGIHFNFFIVTALVDMYGKCGSVLDARSVFEELDTADLVSWTAMIVVYVQRNLLDEALALFTDDKWANVLPNSVTIASILSACAQLGNLNFGKLVHSLGIKLGLEDSTVINALVNMYAKCHMIEEARYIFDTITDKDVVAWNSMISGCSQNGYAYEALELFCRMRYAFSLDAITIVSALSACACLGALYFGCALHAYALKGGFLPSNVYVGTALLNLYSKCGDSGSARRVFNEMGDKNTVTWSAMMAGYGMHGDATESFNLFKNMLKENLEPNEVVFTSILSACSHTGRLGEAWKYFDSMCKEYHVVPSMKHYVCMIDLLARAGRLKEAMEFIESMPFEADVRVWGALLHGCRLHSKLDLAEVAMKRMLELQPDNAGYYVLISNLYALDKRWDKVNEMRELMKERGLNKSPGCSLVEMDKRDDLSDLREASFV